MCCDKRSFWGTEMHAHHQTELPLEIAEPDHAHLHDEPTIDDRHRGRSDQLPHRRQQRRSRRLCRRRPLGRRRSSGRRRGGRALHRRSARHRRPPPGRGDRAPRQARPYTDSSAPLLGRPASPQEPSGHLMSATAPGSHCPHGALGADKNGPIRATVRSPQFGHRGPLMLRLVQEDT